MSNVSDAEVEAAKNIARNVDSPTMARALSAAYAARWRPIETAPKPPHTHLLVRNCDKGWVRFGKRIPGQNNWYYSGTNERSQWSQVRGDEPTHWQPLPRPPGDSNDL